MKFGLLMVCIFLFVVLLALWLLEMVTKPLRSLFCAQDKMAGE
jgi:hypothetical protein